MPQSQVGLGQCRYGAGVHFQHLQSGFPRLSLIHIFTDDRIAPEAAQAIQARGLELIVA